MKTNILTKELNSEELLEVKGGAIEVKFLSTILAFIKGDFSPQL